LLIKIAFYNQTGFHHYPKSFVMMMLMYKVHKSKGRTLFVVYVKPSKNKLDCLSNKIPMYLAYVLLGESKRQVYCLNVMF
jgi:hypothetical protein